MRKGLGSTYTQNDYEVWHAHFGQPTGSGSVSPRRMLRCPNHRFSSSWEHWLCYLATRHGIVNSCVRDMHRISTVLKVRKANIRSDNRSFCILPPARTIMFEFRFHNQS